MVKRVIATLLFGIILLIGSCGDGDDTKMKTMSVNEFFTEYLQTLCEASAQCNGGFITTTNSGSCPSIIRSLSQPYEFFHQRELVVFNQKLEALKRAGTNQQLLIDKEQAAVCFNIVKELEPCNPLKVSLFDIVECQKAFIGETYPHNPCFQDEECEGGWCDINGTQCPGTCVLYREANQACNDRIDKCEPGYACRGSGCSKVTQGEAGDPCTSDEHCSDYLYCKINEGDAAGLCLRKKEAGKACVTSEECVIGLECIENQCLGTLIENTAGGQCDNETRFCNYFSRLECSPSGICQALPNAANQMCTYICETPFYCSPSQKKCLYMSEGGQQCESNEACKSYLCSNGVCIVPDCVPVIVVE